MCLPATWTSLKLYKMKAKSQRFAQTDWHGLLPLAETLQVSFGPHCAKWRAALSAGVSHDEGLLHPLAEAKGRRKRTTTNATLRFELRAMTCDFLVPFNTNCLKWTNYDKLKSFDCWNCWNCWNCNKHGRWIDMNRAEILRSVPWPGHKALLLSFERRFADSKIFFLLLINILLYPFLGRRRILWQMNETSRIYGKVSYCFATLDNSWHYAFGLTLHYDSWLSLFNVYLVPWQVWMARCCCMVPRVGPCGTLWDPVLPGFYS